MNIEHFLGSKETYDKVVNKLTEISGTNIDGGLGGFLAGGAVSNIIYSLIYGGEPVVRDIDIFNYIDNNDGWDVDYDEDTTIEVHGRGITDCDQYGNLYIRSDGDFSVMRSHKRVGVLNYVDVSIGSSKPIFNKDMILLNGFDLNCCQSGLDLVGGKILYTKHFLKFLKTRELLVTTPISPLQTAIRMLRKVKDLGCYCNINNEIKLLQHVMFCDRIPNKIGPETYGKCIEYKDVIDKFFNIKNKDKDTYEYYPKLERYDLIMIIRDALSLLNYWRVVNGNVCENKKKKFKKIINKIYEKGVGDINKYHECFVTRTNFRDHISGNDNYKNLFNSEVHIIHHIIWNHLLTNVNYYDCDFHDKHIDYVVDFLDNHSFMSRIFRFCDGLTLQTQYEIIKTIKTLSNKFGGWVIGELESVDVSHLYYFGVSDNKKQWLLDFIESVNNKSSMDIVEPLDISNFEYKNCVRELTSTKQLREEGFMMGHCVGGYTNNLSNGVSRIFHIDCDGIGSTLEVNIKPSSWYSRVSPQTNWLDHIPHEELVKYNEITTKIEELTVSIRQHYGRYPEKGNLTPTDINRGIANSLIDYLNEFVVGQPLKMDLLQQKKDMEEKFNDIIKYSEPNLSEIFNF